MFKRMLLISLLLLLTITPTAVGATADDDTTPGRYQISIIVMGPGDDLFARFGHIGIMVEDRAAPKGSRQEALVYNYGTFSFDEPGLWLKYTQGYLNYWLSASRYSWTIAGYRNLDRQLERYTLNFTAAEAASVAEFLQDNIKPQNRYFFYRHYLDNCCTRIRDIINKITNGRFKEQTNKDATGHTYRYWTRYSLKNRPIMNFLIDYVLGSVIDHPITRWEEYFLPQNFAEDLGQITLPDGRSLVKEHQVLHQRQEEPPSAHWPIWEGIVFWLLIALLITTMIIPVIAGPKNWSKRLYGLGLFLWGLLPGIGGLLLILFLFTQHLDTHWNSNIVITPVSHLFLIWVAWGALRLKDNLPQRVTWARNYLLGASLVDIIVLALKFGPFIQNNYAIIITMLVINLWLALVMPKRLQLAKGANNE